MVYIVRSGCLVDNVSYVHIVVLAHIDSYMYITWLVWLLVHIHIYIYIYIYVYSSSLDDSGRPRPARPKCPEPCRSRATPKPTVHCMQSTRCMYRLHCMHGCIVYKVSYVHIAVSAHIYSYYYISLPIDLYTLLYQHIFTHTTTLVSLLIHICTLYNTYVCYYNILLFYDIAICIFVCSVYCYALHDTNQKTYYYVAQQAPGEIFYMYIISLVWLLVHINRYIYIYICILFFLGWLRPPTASST